MVSGSLLCLLAGAIPVFSSALKPLVAHDVRHVNSLDRRHLDLGVLSNLERRDLTLGTYSLVVTLPPSDILFTVALGTYGGGSANGSLSLTATCISCYTTGTATVSTDGVKQDDTILGDIQSFIASSDKTEIVTRALGLDLEVQLDNLGGHFEFDIDFAAAGTYTVPVFKSNTPLSVELDDSHKIGLAFSIELTLTVSDSVDLTTGFDIVFPTGASFKLNPITGELVEMNIGGAQVNSLPVIFKKGTGCIAAVLRLKFQVGVALEVFGESFDFESGVFFDPLQHKACVGYQPNQPCGLQLTENFYEEIGAYARAVKDIDFASLSAGPSAVSTFFTGALPSQCLSTSVSNTTVTPTISPPVPQTTASSATAPWNNGTITASSLSSGPTATLPIYTYPNSTSPTNVSYGTGTGTGSTYSATATSISGGIFQPSGTGTIGTGAGSAGGIYSSAATGAPYANTSSFQSFSPVLAIPTSLPFPTDQSTSYTTDTITWTSTITISSCAPQVTACSSIVTTEVYTTTTLCPVAAVSSVNAAIASPTASSTIELTTTIISTVTYTITSCLSNVVQCPASLQSTIVQTKPIVPYTTVAPVTQTDFPASPPLPAPVQAGSSAGAIATTPSAYTGPVNPGATNSVSLTPVEAPITETIDVYQTLTETVYATFVGPSFTTTLLETLNLPYKNTYSSSPASTAAQGGLVSYPANHYAPLSQTSTAITTSSSVLAPYYPYSNSSSLAFPTASGVSGVGSISRVVSSTTSGLSGSAFFPTGLVISTGPVQSTAPIYPSNYEPQPYYGGNKREASPMAKLYKKSAGASSVVPRYFTAFVCLALGVIFVI